ncbi:hypothetical protein AM1_1356 [Acaryochloris marina MBIC11017]|uniref:Uncharacterized protein n=1 Tax=Acaryochloris marina (strain MBIC 11017) TaxID=329726 RepID=B0C6G7_ACAM1|nr:hypothetical protein AM1_1356 [Acaryochloris marina MBIC11017]
MKIDQTICKTEKSLDTHETFNITFFNLLIQHKTSSSDYHH